MAKSKIGIKPLGKTVLLQFKKMKETSESGIILPESIHQDVEQKEAIVIALGSGNLSDGKKHKFEVSVGDTVIIPAQAGARIEKNNESYVVVDESRITAILE